MTQCGLTATDNLWPATQAQSVIKAEYKRSTSGIQAKHERNKSDYPAGSWLVPGFRVA